MHFVDINSSSQILYAHVILGYTGIIITVSLCNY